MKLLICSDGSAQAENAVSFGGLVAGGCGSEVHLLGTAEKQGEEAVLLGALKRNQKNLQDRGVPATLIQRTGEPTSEILKQTQETHYDLVVIGAVRKARVGAFWMSAKAYKLIKSVQQPVLAVIGHRNAIKRILICSGGRPYIEKGVEMASCVAKGLGSRATIVHVMPEVPAMYSEIAARQDDVDALLKSSSNLAQNLRREKELLEKAGVQTTVKVRLGEVIRELLMEIRTGNYDLVVTGSSITHGRFSTYVMGDVTREIVNHSDCPVLVTRSEMPVRQDILSGLLSRFRTGSRKPKT
jgi:nucleotide-binding universal stress UspA family protein